MTNIGIIDSGVGGLTVLFDVIQKFPNCNYFYIGDSKNCPYGDKTPSEIRKLSYDMVKYLVEEKNISILIIACNSIASTSFEFIQNKYPYLNIIETVIPTSNYVKNNLNSKKIGVIATSATINSDAYQKRLEQYDVISKACPNFVKIIENAPISSEDERKILNELEEIFKYDIDTLILGCTHYPILIPIIRKVYNGNIVTSSNAIIEELSKFITKDDLKGKVEIYTTKDSTKFSNQIKLIFDKDYKVHEIKFGK